jgi:hypothetical protein
MSGGQFGRRIQAQKRQAVRNTACLRLERVNNGLDVGLGLAQALDAVARFPLAALFEEIDALETLQDVAFDDDAAGTLETLML